MKLLVEFYRFGAIALFAAISASPGHAAPAHRYFPGYESVRRSALVSSRGKGGDSSVISNLNLNRIVARSDSDLWIVGFGGVKDHFHAVIANSSDAGSTWRSILQMSDADFYDIRFLTPQVGFVTGWSLKDRRGLILRTNDGGARWQSMEVDVADLLIAVGFVDADWGWILGSEGNLLRTSDGGVTWTAYHIGATKNLRRIGSAGRQNVWVTGDDGQVYQSIDGGETWRSRGHQLMNLLPRLRFKKVDFANITFFGSNRGFLAAEALVPTGKNVHGEVLYETTGIVFTTGDGGTNWTAKVVTANLGLASAQFMSERDAWLVPSWNVKRSFLHSGDGGKNWGAIPYHDEMGDPYSVYFLDANNGWLFSSYGLFYSQLFRTTDGGRTWVRYTE